MLQTSPGMVAGPADDPLSRPKAQAILEAARRLFTADGLPGTSVDAIAKAAGVSKATLYGYFESKVTLFAAVVAGQCRFQTDFLEVIEDWHAPPREALARFGRGLLGFILAPENVALYRLIVSEAARTPELGQAFYAAGPGGGMQRLAEYLARMQAQGALRAGEPRRMADHLLSLLRGDIHLRALFGVGALPGPDEIAVHVEGAVDAFVAAYGVQR